VDAVKSSITNIVQTFRGSRRMIPEFAANLWEYLFEPIDEITAQSIGEEIIAAIERWDDRVVIQNIHVSPQYERNQYNITVTFRLKNSNQAEEVEIILQRG
jgi:phage baseplate assembly protein W